MLVRSVLVSPIQNFRIRVLKDGCGSHLFFSSGGTMKEFQKLMESTIKQVFGVYNYSPDFSKFQFTYKTSKSDFRVKDRFCIENNKVRASICIKKSDNDYLLFETVGDIDREKSCFKHCDFIGLNCIKALKSFYYAFVVKSFNKSMLYHIIDKTIETSIIAVLIGNKQPSALADPLLESISNLLQSLSGWSTRTYEGRKIPFSFLIDLNTINSHLNLFDDLCSFLHDDASALVTDGITSYIALGDTIEYKIAPYYNPEQYEERAKGTTDKKIPLVPYRFTSFGAICANKNIGIVLTVQGDILFIKSTKLFFAKRNGEWHFYDYDSFNTVLFKDIPEISSKPQKAIRIKTIYLTCLDVAFARTGGCLAICETEQLSDIKKNIRKADIHKPFSRTEHDDKYKKRFMLEEIIIQKHPFFELGRKARQEIMGIDGATIILTDGRFITTGAIIDNQATKKANEGTKETEASGGARKKITMKLSEYGIAIKISADGYIECFKNRKHIF